MSRYRLFRWFSVLPLFALVSCVPARAAVLYVNKNAAGAIHDGASWSTAFITIQDAVTAANRGDEIWVAASFPAAPAYIESIAMGTGVGLYGGFAGTETQRSQRDWKANATIIDGNQADVVINIASTVPSQVVIDGFTIRNGSAGTSTQVGYGVLASGQANISNSIITGNGGIGVCACPGTMLMNDVICGNGGTGVSGSGTDKYLRVIISSSTICGNNGDGVSVDDDFAAAFVWGVTICGNGGNGISANGNVSVANTIVADNGCHGIAVVSYATVSFLSNDVYGNAMGEYSGFAPPVNAGNLSLDPKLSSTCYNVHLQPGSPCIDAGIDSYVYGATDIDGQARKAGAHVDIGSDESDGTIWPTSGPTLFVSPNGSDAADGLTWATAKKTVGAALAVAGAASDVWVAKGTYLEMVTVPSGVALYGGFDGTESVRSQRSVSANPTVLDGGGGTGDIVTCRLLNATVDGFTIRNGGNGIAMYGGVSAFCNNAISANTKNGVYAHGGTATVSNNTVTGNAADGVYVLGVATLTNNVISQNGTGVYVDEMSDVTLTGNSISQNSKIGVYIGNFAKGTLIGNTVAHNSGTGVSADSFSTATLTGNNVSTNEGDGVRFEGAAAALAYNIVSGNGQDGVDSSGTMTLADNTICGNGQDGVYSYQEAHLTNNTIVGNGQAGVNTSGLATFMNNIVATNGGFGLHNTGVVSAFSHNDVFGNASGAYYKFTPAADQGNVSVDPMLSNIYHDVHLQPGSPCIDAGDDSAVTPGQTDVYGKPRIIGAHVDIGADESDGTAWTVPSRVWFVSPAGSDSADGQTWGTAKKTVIGALSVCQGGDEVWVANGTYRETVEIPCSVGLYGGFVGNETDRGARNASANPTVFDGGGGSIDVVTARFFNTVVDGFTIRNGENGVNVISGLAMVTNDLVSGNIEDGVCVNDGTAMVINSTLTSNAGNGVEVLSGAATLANDTITGNCGTGVANYSNASLSNTIIAFNRGEGVYTDSSVTMPVYSHNDVYGNTTGNYQGYTPPANMGNISVDPMLSSVYHDIHLQPGSPCINTGDDSVVTPGQTDFYGKPRIIGAHVDIGADESDGTVWTVPSRVWYVSPAGSDLADGLTWSTAKGTVNGALFASQGGDEVWVAKGTYVETVRIPNGVGLYGGFGGSEADRSERNAITNPTVLDGGGGSANVVALVFSNNIVDSFTLRNGGYGVYLRTGTHTISNDTISGNSFGGVIANYGTLTLTNNTVSGNAGSGIVVQRGSTASLTNNTVFSNTGAGVSVAGSATLDRNSICGNSSYGVYIGYNALLTRNIICRNTLHGVFVYSATATLKDNTILSNSKCGVDLVVSSATVANNTISDNGSDGISDSNISAVTNNVVVFNGGYGVHRGAGSFVTYSHNDVYGNTAGQYSNYLPPANMANISADPLFADRASSDYHLLVGSPCIDAGDDSVLTSGETDIEGNPRKQKAHVDIGAYEFPAPGCYTLADVTLALRIAAGLSVLDGPGLARLNVATDGGSASVVDVSDAVSLIRKVAGPEPNP